MLGWEAPGWRDMLLREGIRKLQGNYDGADDGVGGGNALYW